MGKTTKPSRHHEVAKSAASRHRGLPKSAALRHHKKSRLAALRRLHGVPMPKTAPAATTSTSTAATDHVSAISGGLANLFSSFFPKDGLDFTKKIGKAVYDIFKGFAEGTYKIEPLDIYTAISDLIKSFFNAMFECVVKPAAKVAGIADDASPKMRKISGDGPGDRKRSVEKASMPATKGLGFSSGSRDAGLHGYANRSSSSEKSFAADAHDELYDDSMPISRKGITREGIRRPFS